MSFAGCFIKFGQLEHIIALQTRGLLYFNPVDFFLNIDDNNLRGDILENVSELEFIGEAKISV